jgi:DNA-binding CsgD family transcriptional regulator
MTDTDIPVSPLQRRRKLEGRHSNRLPKTSLSPRETEICNLLVKGMQTKEVAHQLNISIHTAFCHMHNAYVKLDVRNRAELVTRLAAPNVNAVRDTLTESISASHTIETRDEIAVRRR